MTYPKIWEVAFHKGNNPKVSYFFHFYPNARNFAYSEAEKEEIKKTTTICINHIEVVNINNYTFVD